MSIEDLRKAEKELSDIYLRVAAYFKRMSKIKDEHGWRIVQSAIDGELSKAGELRTNIGNAKREIVAEWEKSRRQNPLHKSKYD